MAAITFDSVSKGFSRASGRALLRHHLAGWLKRGHAQHSRDFYALKRVSFRVEPRESLAVIGPNGAGKSTLLSLVAGLAKPDEGVIAVTGRVAALLELGSGFHYDLTGAENVRLNASLLGLTRKETSRLFDSILDFSGIGDFIREPLRTYSSGMVMRLAFSIAVNVDPDILLIDEVLAVGDQSFQAKCFEEIHKLRRNGKTLLCVSHAPGMLHELCDRAIWLDRGELVMEGALGKVADAYAGRQQTATT